MTARYACQTLGAREIACIRHGAMQQFTLMQRSSLWTRTQALRVLSRMFIRLRATQFTLLNR